MPFFTGGGEIVRAANRADDAARWLRTGDRLGDTADALRIADRFDALGDMLGLARQADNAGDVLVTGAREVFGELDPWKARDWERAEDVYDIIRGMDDDVATIVRNTGISECQVRRVRNHVFYDLHQLDESIRRFHADPEIVNTWKRMLEGTHTEADMRLFRHELYESRFEGMFNLNARQAHDTVDNLGIRSGLQ